MVGMARWALGGDGRYGRVPQVGSRGSGHYGRMLQVVLEAIGNMAGCHGQVPGERGTGVVAAAGPARASSRERLES